MVKIGEGGKEERVNFTYEARVVIGKKKFSFSSLFIYIDPLFISRSHLRRIQETSAPKKDIGQQLLEWSPDNTRITRISFARARDIVANTEKISNNGGNYEFPENYRPHPCSIFTRYILTRNISSDIEPAIIRFPHLYAMQSYNKS